MTVLWALVMDNDLDGGWIYVMMTSSNYNRFKVGRTNGNPLDRAKKLRTGDPGIDLQTAYFIPALHGKLSKIEAALHREFGQRISFHDETTSEWFYGNAKWACVLIEGLFEDWVGQPVTGMHMVCQDRICRAYAEDLISFYGPVPPLDVDGIPY
jgi:hypothetical protein